MISSIGAGVLSLSIDLDWHSSLYRFYIEKQITGQQMQGCQQRLG